MQKINKESIQKTKQFWKNNYFLLLSLIPLIFIIIFQKDRVLEIPIFFGDQSVALFDLWSIQHFLVGILIGSLLLGSEKTEKPVKKWRVIIPFMIFVAISWEAVEVFLENGHILFNSFEGWSNRLITDPLMALLGGMVGYLIKDSWKIAVVPAILWLVIKALLL